MPKHPGDPLRKVTINLYEADCAFLEAHYGYGWSELAREVVHEQVQKMAKHTKPPLTVGDLVND